MTWVYKNPSLWPAETFATSYERRAVHLYLDLACSVLEIGNPADHYFWTRLLPQASIERPAIRSALVALASFLECLVNPVRAGERQERAQVNYGKTIRVITSLKLPNKNINVDEMLMACIVLTCLESFRYDIMRANVHVKGAQSILIEERSHESPQVTEDALASIVDRLALKASLTTGQHIMKQKEQPEYTVQDMQIHLMRTIAVVCNALVVPQRAGTQPVAAECLEVLETWRHDLSALRCQEQGTGARMLLAYMEIQYLLTHLTLSRTLSRLDCGFVREDWQDDAACREIMTVCEIFAELNDLNSGTEARFFGPKIRLDFGIELILTVFFIAIHCRTLSIRRLAVDFLCKTYRRDLSWDSFHAAKIADWVINWDLEGLRKGQNPSDNQPDLEAVHLLRIGFYRTLDNTNDSENPSIPSSFHRPSWALLRFKHQSRIGEHWLNLEGDVLDTSHVLSNSSTSLTQRPDGLAFCYCANEPYIPSAAAKIILAQRKVEQEVQRQASVVTSVDG